MGSGEPRGGYSRLGTSVESSRSIRWNIIIGCSNAWFIVYRSIPPPDHAFIFTSMNSSETTDPPHVPYDVQLLTRSRCITTKGTFLTNRLLKFNRSLQNDLYALQTFSVLRSPSMERLSLIFQAPRGNVFSISLFLVSDPRTHFPSWFVSDLYPVVVHGIPAWQQ